MQLWSDACMDLLPPNQQLAAPGGGPVVGEKASRRSDVPWTAGVTGLVESPRTRALGSASTDLLTPPQREFVLRVTGRDL